MAIFLLIAGTYTPFCLTVLNGWIGWTLFGVVWACAVAGIILKVFSTGSYEVLSTVPIRRDGMDGPSFYKAIVFGNIN